RRKRRRPPDGVGDAAIAARKAAGTGKRDVEQPAVACDREPRHDRAFGVRLVRLLVEAVLRELGDHLHQVVLPRLALAIVRGPRRGILTGNRIPTVGCLLLAGAVGGGFADGLWWRRRLWPWL